MNPMEAKFKGLVSRSTERIVGAAMAMADNCEEWEIRAIELPEVLEQFALIMKSRLGNTIIRKD